MHVGTSGWSYPSWKPGLYPAGTAAKEFLRLLREDFSTVELNTTGYRFPAEGSSRAGPSRRRRGSRSRPSSPATGRAISPSSATRVRRSATGSGRCASADERTRRGHARAHPRLARPGDSASRSTSSTNVGRDRAPPGGGRHGTRQRSHTTSSEAPFRYVRFRDPPYTDGQLHEWASRLRGAQEPVYAYFRHEDAPAAPRYAQRLLELLGQ